MLVWWVGGWVGAILGWIFCLVRRTPWWRKGRGRGTANEKGCKYIFVALSFFLVLCDHDGGCSAPVVVFLGFFRGFVLS